MLAELFASILPLIIAGVAGAVGEGKGLFGGFFRRLFGGGSVVPPPPPPPPPPVENPLAGLLDKLPDELKQIIKLVLDGWTKQKVVEAHANFQAMLPHVEALKAV